ncbi:MAG: cell division ATP-binding protein FtsE [Candidatus Harrisonbacteria bacterium RIFCSPLOWO2_01_FULL_44_18]|uniref:Cell division ATP-binding protein FtsE n=1 Tax=Candidatus Harrisonbacteria bacterium RIFCSPLOWO2_01_FULL_44_18 TaxID=1798407 RepID=A0A1G1ZLQ7_9BACT|nr:MAG: cell division ATP-binding protein FtsE [Candidatus Harrisonbacteria bacterium RIFCSPLOWO2_01_FULL_44_18]
MIAFQNVSKIYNDHSTALEDVDLKINPTEFVSIVGKSGAGKSTIIKLLIGEEKPSRGRVIFGSWEVNKLKPKDLPQLRRQIGIVFQDFKLLPTKTAYENVAFALEVEGRQQWEIEELVPQVLDMVGLADKKNNFPHELSGGEKQRVAIARAMIHRPSVLVADEPTGNLDDANTEEIVRLLLKINELGTTVILATHNKHIVNRLEKRVITISDGRLVRDEEKGKYFLV